jgi:hypothetical protein
MDLIDRHFLTKRADGPGDATGDSAPTPPQGLVGHIGSRLHGLWDSAKSHTGLGDTGLGLALGGGGLALGAGAAGLHHILSGRKKRREDEEEKGAAGLIDDLEEGVGSVLSAGQPKDHIGPFKAEHGARTLGLDPVIASIARNRDEHPYHYWLNPFVSGPVREGLARLGRRYHASQATSPTLATLAHLPFSGAANVVGALGSMAVGGAGRREKARGLYEHSGATAKEEGRHHEKEEKEEKKESGDWLGAHLAKLAADPPLDLGVAKGGPPSGMAAGAAMPPPAYMRPGTVGNTQFNAFNRGNTLNETLMSHPRVNAQGRARLQEQMDVNNHLLGNLTGLRGKPMTLGSAEPGIAKGGADDQAPATPTLPRVIGHSAADRPAAPPPMMGRVNPANIIPSTPSMTNPATPPMPSAVTPSQTRELWGMMPFKPPVHPVEAGMAKPFPESPGQQLGTGKPGTYPGQGMTPAPSPRPFRQIPTDNESRFLPPQAANQNAPKYPRLSPSGVYTPRASGYGYSGDPTRSVDDPLIAAGQMSKSR